MGLFEKVFGNKKTKPPGTETFFKTLTAYTPVFTSWNGALYEVLLVRASIHAKAKHISKLKVDCTGLETESFKKKFGKKPNSFQTWSKFLYRLATILEMQNTAFIVPMENELGETVGIYPILPSRCCVIEYAGTPYLRYEFSNGDRAVVEFEKCGVFTKFQYKDDFFGEENNALIPTMELMHLQNQGIKEAVKNGATFRFMAQTTNFSNDEDIEKERKRFSEKNFASENGGLLLFSNKFSNVKQIESKPFVVDKEQMQIIKDNVFDYFGVNEDILQNKVYGDAWASFYEGEIEPFSIQLSETLTQMLFKNKSGESTEIVATTNRLQYLSNQEKLQVATGMGDRGYLTVNEVREMFNLPLVPGKQGDLRPIRGEYYLVGKDGSITQKGGS